MAVALASSGSGNNGLGGTTIGVAFNDLVTNEPKLFVLTVSIANALGQTVSTITSDPVMTWTLIKATDNGVSVRTEVWWAWSKERIDGSGFTITLSASAAASAVCGIYTGAAHLGESGASGIGSLVGSATGNSAEAIIVYTPRNDRSLITGHAGGAVASAVTAGTGETLVQDDTATTLACSGQEFSTTQSKVGSPQTINCILDISMSWVIITVELIPELILPQPRLFPANVSMRTINRVVTY
jgi:hypothetical protein